MKETKPKPEVKAKAGEGTAEANAKAKVPEGDSAAKEKKPEVKLDLSKFVPAIPLEELTEKLKVEDGSIPIKAVVD